MVDMEFYVVECFRCTTIVLTIRFGFVCILRCAGVVSTLAGSGSAAQWDGEGVAAAFNFPAGVSVDSNGAVFVADTLNNRIRMISSAGEELGWIVAVDCGSIFDVVLRH
jgi:hypothetical protein